MSDIPSASQARSPQNARGQCRRILIFLDGPESEIHGPDSKTGHFLRFAQSGNVGGRW
jgi:hypothetical protein